MNNHRYKQQGLSLIEMMIAMVISLVLIAGVGTVYFSSKRNYETRDQLSVMDENARVALDTLRKHLEHAGYATAQKLPLGDYFYVSGDAAPIAIPCDADGKGNLKYITDLTSRPTQDAINQYGDSISVRFIGDDALFSDAVNGELPAGCRVGAAPSLEASLIYNAFQIDTSSTIKDSQGNLIPILYAVGSRVQDKQPVVNGIENMQFMYGLDAGADGTVDQYVNATGVGAGNWQRVISIRVALLVRSLEPVLAANTAQSYTLLDVNVTPNDRYQRAVYTTTIQLRNVVDG